MKRLVLFDIDGTILNGGKLFRRSFESAIREVFPNRDFPRVSFSGKTDRQISVEMLTAVGEPIDPFDAAVDRILENYLGRVRQAMAEGQSGEIVLLPGIRPLIERLATEPGVRLGLLTGNVRAGAALKLSLVGLDHHFKFGAFGDDHWDRYQLPAIALKKALQEFDLRYSGKELVIIGDTPHDVNCGKSVNARSIAVATGRPDSRDAILKSNPDFMFETLESTGEVLQAILTDEIPSVCNAGV